MNEPLRILYVEDNRLDRELVAAALYGEGLTCKFAYAATEKQFTEALGNFPCDIILSDFTLPSFSGSAALQLAKNAKPDVPFLFVSGTIGEELAVESLKRGATDYVLKGHLDRLGPTVRRALREAKERAERLRAEQLLRGSEERFRQLAENINEVFWISDKNKAQILYVSPAYEKIWGRSCDSAYTDPISFTNAIHLEDRDRIMCRLEAQKLSAPYDEEYRIVRPDGEIRWIHDRGFPVRDEQNLFYRLVGIAEDITERKQLEEQLRQSQKMEAIGQLAGGVAHDFNNLLCVIRGNAELALMQPEKLSVEASDCLKHVTDAADRAAGLTRQLLAFGRKQIMQARPLNLDEVIGNLTKMLGRIIGEDIRLQRNYCGGAAVVHADIGMLEQVLMNLVVNARDAMAAGGELWITTQRVTIGPQDLASHPEGRSGEFVCLMVRDTGTGIVPEHLPRIFEPFFTTKEVGKGTGLGLATAYGIVKQHQGWIEVATQIGLGTTFRVFLPALTTVPADTQQVAQVKVQGGHESVLLVEDEDSVRSLTARVLGGMGYNVLQAASGKAALEIWREHGPQIDLLITDLIMPDGLTGLELADRLTSLKPSLKAILTSGYSPEVAGRGTEFFRRVQRIFLPKPYTAHDLLEAVRKSLDHS